MTYHCRDCGAEIGEDGWCPYCGEPLEIERDDPDIDDEYEARYGETTEGK